MLAHDLVRAVALDAFRAGVPTDDMPLGIEHDDGIVLDAVHQQAETVVGAQHGGWGSRCRAGLFCHKSLRCFVTRLRKPHGRGPAERGPSNIASRLVPGDSRDLPRIWGFTCFAEYERLAVDRKRRRPVDACFKSLLFRPSASTAISAAVGSPLGSSKPHAFAAGHGPHPGTRTQASSEALPTARQHASASVRASARPN